MKNQIFKLHQSGKLNISSTIKITDKKILSAIYTPGVGEVCKAIAAKPELVEKYTIKSKTIAVITDGSAVLGFGNIGAAAALPVMEGKCAIFKEFAGIDSFPICLDTQNTKKIIETIINIAPVFGAINLEDISAPRCFEIERALDKKLNIPVFHDDQHGTAVVVFAALKNALKIVKKQIDKIKIVIIGAGAAGSAITELLLNCGVKNIIITDKFGIIYKSRRVGMNKYLLKIAQKTNRENIKGNLENAVDHADIIIGVSAANIIKSAYIKKMAANPIIFALANPTPEIMPELAYKAGAFIVGTGRSDYPNQINNALCYPGLFKGLLKYKIKTVTDEIKINAAAAIAELISAAELNEQNILPSIFDKRVVDAVAESVKKFSQLNKKQIL